MLKAIASVYNIIENGGGLIKDRLMMSPGNWRRFRQIRGILLKMMQGIYSTVPQNKLIAMRRDMDNAYADIKVKTVATGWKPTEELIVSMDDLMPVIKEATEVRCWGCNKCGKEARRCALYQHIDRMLIYEYDTVDIACPFSRGDIAGYSLKENA